MKEPRRSSDRPFLSQFTFYERFPMPRKIPLLPLLGLGVALSCSVGATAERPKANWIDGEWHAVTTVMGGQPSPTLTIQGDRSRFEFDTGIGGLIFFEASITTVDPDQNPAHMDLLFEDTNLPPEFGDAREHLGKTIKAIYQIDGDQLTIVNGEPGTKRPNSLEHGDDPAVQFFSGRRAEASENLTVNAGLPAELAGVWNAFEPLVLTVNEGLIEVRYSAVGEPFEQYELLALGFDAQGAGRMSSIILETENRGMVGRHAVSRVEFDGPDRMITAQYPPGHPQFGKWPESADPAAVPQGMLLAIWERKK